MMKKCFWGYEPSYTPSTCGCIWIPPFLFSVNILGFNPFRLQVLKSATFFLISISTFFSSIAFFDFVNSLFDACIDGWPNPLWILIRSRSPLIYNTNGNYRYSIIFCKRNYPVQGIVGVSNVEGSSLLAEVQSVINHKRVTSNKWKVYFNYREVYVYEQVQLEAWNRWTISPLHFVIVIV